MTHKLKPRRDTPSDVMQQRTGPGDIPRRRHPSLVVVFALAGTLGMLGGCDRADDGNGLQKINGSVHVVAGKMPSVAETVNGGIDIDDNAAVWAGLCGLTQGRQRRLGAEENAGQVHRAKPLPFVEARFLDALAEK